MSNSQALLLHKKLNGKIATMAKIKLTRKALPLIYSPGVADVVREISKNPEAVYDLTIKGNTVAVVTDGSAVLGLGNVGPEAALPVMEGKCFLFKELAGINAFPICLRTQEVHEIVTTIKNIAPVFGAICLEDISAPRCFEIEEKLQGIDIPVIHDDQHAIAIAVLAALINAMNVVDKKIPKAKIVIVGAGAAGIATAKLLLAYNNHSSHLELGARSQILVVDSKGILSPSRTDLNPYKRQVTQMTNRKNVTGSLKDAAKDADVLIGLSTKGLFTKEIIQAMNKNPVVFALANPDPEVLPSDVKKWGVKIIATGRSDFPNQLNNALVFPGLFKGFLQSRKTKLTDDMKIAAAKSLASIIKNPTPQKIIPSIFDRRILSIMYPTIEI